MLDIIDQQTLCYKVNILISLNPRLISRTIDTTEQMMKPIWFELFISEMTNPKTFVNSSYFMLVVDAKHLMNVGDGNLLNYLHYISEATWTCIMTSWLLWCMTCYSFCCPQVTGELCDGVHHCTFKKIAIYSQPFLHPAHQPLSSNIPAWPPKS